MRAILRIACVVCVLFAVVAVTARAADAPPAPTLRLAGLFSDHVVLQRDMELPVWGTAQPGAAVTVSLGDVKAAATADAKGNWKAKLPPQKAGGPFGLAVAAGNESVVVKDVMIGEVWICSGQSNMYFAVGGTLNARREIATANFPKIRMFTVPSVKSATPVATCGGSWVVCSPETAAWFSGVGYYFGRELNKELDVPIGLIHSSWGGSLCEAWMSREVLEKNPDYKDILTRAANDPWNGAGLYNGMIHPLIPYAIRGAIWYQGESNSSRAYQYRTLFPALIADWRARWGQGDFPFYYVQLAPFRSNPSEWPELWEAQFMTLRTPNTGMAVTTDIGVLDNIHPPNKQEVGRRLALWALAKTYGRKDVVCSGPLYKSMKVEKDKIRISFDYAAGGLAARDGKELSFLEIAGADKKFLPAKAVIDGETILVGSDAVKEPVAVRFGWSDVAQPNLVNKAGLPASPFRTDDWPGATVGRK